MDRTQWHRKELCVAFAVAGGHFRGSGDLVKPHRGITNSDLELAALLLQESYFPLACLRHAWHALSTGSVNTTTVIWCF